MTQNERQELEELKRYKQENESKAMTRAFSRLEALMDSLHDPVMSRRAFRVLAECIVCLRDEVMK